MQIPNGMITVMCFGTFDGLHEGHHFYLREAKKFGDRLIVVVARDATVQTVKGKKSLQSEAQRLADIAAVPEVDKAVLGNIDDKFAIIRTHRPDVLCLGYDQRAFTEQLQERLLAEGFTTTIIRLPPFHPERYKSSKLREG